MLFRVSASPLILSLDLGTLLSLLRSPCFLALTMSVLNMPLPLAPPHPGTVSLEPAGLPPECPPSEQLRPWASFPSSPQGPGKNLRVCGAAFLPGEPLRGFSWVPALTSLFSPTEISRSSSGLNNCSSHQQLSQLPGDHRALSTPANSHELPSHQSTVRPLKPTLDSLLQSCPGQSGRW